MALAFGMMLGGLFWSMMLSSPSSHVFDWAWFMTAFMGTILALPLTVWLGAIWGTYRAKRSWRGRTLLALLPSSLLFATTVLEAARQPPREKQLRQNFRVLFNAEIPMDARKADRTAPTLADSGHVDFIFQCSKQSTLDLIRAMDLKPQEGEPQHYSRIALEWAKSDWKNALSYMRVDREGTRHLLITDSSMERVLMSRWPGWAKSENESQPK